MSRFLKTYRTELGLIVAIALVVGAAWFLSSAYSTHAKRIEVAKDILRDSSLLGIFALGAATVIIAGGIDLSSGSMIAFSGTLFFGFLILLADEVEIEQRIENGTRAIDVEAAQREFVLAGERIYGVTIEDAGGTDISMRIVRKPEGRQTVESVLADDVDALREQSPKAAALYLAVTEDPAVDDLWQRADDFGPDVTVTQTTSARGRTLVVDGDGDRFQLEDDGRGGKPVVTVGTGKVEPLVVRTLAGVRAAKPELGELLDRYVVNVRYSAATRYWVRFGAPIVALLGIVFAALLVGSFHAWLITVLELPPFVATLASLVGLRSLARLLIQDIGMIEYGQRKSTITMGDDVLPSVAADGWWIPCAVFVVVAALFWLLLGRTVIGRHLYAMGGNETAARLSGIRTGRLKWLVYCLGTVTAAIAGVLYACKIGTASPASDGMGYELNAIAASVVGGCSLAGGIGSVAGVMLGAVFLRVVIDSVAKLFKSQPTLLEGLVVGTLVVLTVAFNELRSTPGTKKRFFPGPLGLLTVGTLALLAAVITYVTSTEHKTRNALVVAGVTLVLAGTRATIERLLDRAPTSG